MKKIYTMSLSLILLYSCDMENPGGVLLYNQLPESVITFVDEKKILGDEKIIAYYDITITLNNSESAILTDKNIIYYKYGRIDKIPLSAIESISEEEVCLGECIIIKSLDNSVMSIEIAPLNGGDLFLRLLKEQVAKS
tara:strand:- start:238 stop:651 length:414 start_codon:yes stop_codon:yes gene_type:complete